MSVRTSLAWAYSGQIFSFVVQFAGSIIVARLLSPREMGIFAIAMAMQGVISIFVNFGVGAYIVREPDLKPQTLDAAFTINLMLSVMLATLLLAASFGGSLLFGDAAAGNVLRVSAVSAVLGTLAFRPNVMMQREMRFKAISMIGVSGGVITAVSTIGFALLGQSYMSPAYGGLVSSIIGTGLTIGMARHHHSLRISFFEWRRLTTFGLRMMSVNGVSVLGLRLSDVVLGRLLGVATLGVYARASNLSNLIFDQVYGTATRIVFVQLSKEYRETGELRVTFLRGFQIITGVMWPVLIGLAILSRPAIHILYGEKWAAAAVPLSILMVAQFFTLCFGMNWELFVLRDETARQTRYEVTRSTIGLIVFSIGCMFSLAGAAIGRMLDSFFGFLFYYPHMRRLTRTGPGEIPLIYRDSALLMLAAVLPSLVLMIQFRWSPQTPPILIAASVLLGGVLWLAMAWRLRHPVFEELLMLLRRIRPDLGARLDWRVPR